MRPISLEPRLRFDNASNFINAYTQRVTSPLLLLNHVGTIPFESNPEDIRSREDGWAEYFYKDPPPPDEWIWGRTMLAEVVSEQLIHATLGHALEKSAMYADLVPTSIDASSRKGMTPYQKGIDLCMVQMQPYQGETVLAPICGIDVTVGGNDIVKLKRKKPGFQSRTAMPAIVVPLTALTYDGKKMRPFNQYLDEVARAEVLEKGTYSPFYGLDDRDVSVWKETIRSEMRKGITQCRQGLEEKFADNPFVVDYPYIDDVKHKLDLTEQLLADIPIPPPSG